MPRSIVKVLAAVDGQAPGPWLGALWDKVGHDLFELSRQLDIRPTMAVDVLRRYGLPYPEASANKGRVSRPSRDWVRRRAFLDETGYASTREAVEEVIRRGMSANAAGRFLGVDRRTVLRWAREEGLVITLVGKRKGAYNTDPKHLYDTARKFLSTKVTLPDGSTETLAVLADRVGVTRQALKYRIQKWGVAEALSRPVRTSSGRRRSTWSAK